MKLFKRSLFLVLFFLVSCGTGEVRKYTYDRLLMTTIFQVVLYTDKGQSAADNISEQVFQTISDLENKYSVTLSNSLVFRANETGVIEPLDPETRHILSNALYYAEKTGGSFDITVYPVMKLWGFYNEEFKVADKSKVQELMQLVGYTNVLIQSNRVMLTNGAQLDLGGCLKGYAVDKVVALLKSRGIKAGIVNAGGNLRVFGIKPDNAVWKIGIRHPRKQGEIFKSIELQGETSLSTSGDYERYFIVNGTRYHHILNPRTGFPANNGLASVTIMDRSAEEADILSTALFVMGLDRGMEFANTNGISAFFISERNGKISSTNSLFWK
jgi:FAD:protein FMN transferase